MRFLFYLCEKLHEIHKKTTITTKHTQFIQFYSYLFSFMANIQKTSFNNPMYSISDFLQGIADFEAYVVESDFVRIFGKEEGFMLWNAYKRRCECNTTIFYRMLDSQERQKFEAYLINGSITRIAKDRDRDRDDVS